MVNITKSTDVKAQEKYLTTHQGKRCLVPVKKNLAGSYVVVKFAGNSEFSFVELKDIYFYENGSRYTLEEYLSPSLDKKTIEQHLTNVSNGDLFYNDKTKVESIFLSENNSFHRFDLNFDHPFWQEEFDEKNNAMVARVCSNYSADGNDYHIGDTFELEKIATSYSVQTPFTTQILVGTSDSKTKTVHMIKVQNFELAEAGDRARLTLKDDSKQIFAKLENISVDGKPVDDLSTCVGKSVTVKLDDGSEVETEPLTLLEASAIWQAKMVYQGVVDNQHAMEENSFVFTKDGRYLKESETVKPIRYNFTTDENKCTAFLARIETASGIVEVVVSKYYIEKATKSNGEVKIQGYTISKDKLFMLAETGSPYPDVVQTTSGNSPVEQCTVLKKFNEATTRYQEDAENREELMKTASDGFVESYKRGEYKIDHIWEEGKEQPTQLDQRRKRYLLSDSYTREDYAETTREYQTASTEDVTVKIVNGKAVMVKGGPKYSAGKGCASDYKTLGSIVGNSLAGLCSLPGILVCVACPPLVAVAGAAAVLSVPAIPIKNLIQKAISNRVATKGLTSKVELERNETEKEIYAELEHLKSETVSAIAKHEATTDALLARYDNIYNRILEMSETEYGTRFVMENGVGKVNSDNAEQAQKFIKDFNKQLSTQKSLEGRKTKLESKLKKLDAKLESLRNKGKDTATVEEDRNQCAVELYSVDSELTETKSNIDAMQNGTYGQTSTKEVSPKKAKLEANAENTKSLMLTKIIWSNDKQAIIDKYLDYQESLGIDVSALDMAEVESKLSDCIENLDYELTTNIANNEIHSGLFTYSANRRKFYVSFDTNKITENFSYGEYVDQLSVGSRPDLETISEMMPFLKKILEENKTARQFGTGVDEIEDETIEDTEKTLDEIFEEIKQYLAEIERLKSELKEAKDENNNDKEEYVEELRRYLSEIERLEKELQEAKDEIRDDKVKDPEEIKQILSEIERFRIELEETKKEIAKLTARLSKVQDEEKNYEEIGQYLAEIERLRSELQEAKNGIGDDKGKDPEEIKLYLAMIERLEKELKEAKDEIRDDKEKGAEDIKRYLSEIERLKKELQEAKNEIRDGKAKDPGEIKQYLSRIEQLKSELQQAKDEIAKLTERLRKVQDDEKKSTPEEHDGDGIDEDKEKDLEELRQHLAMMASLKKELQETKDEITKSTSSKVQDDEKESTPEEHDGDANGDGEEKNDEAQQQSLAEIERLRTELDETKREIAKLTKRLEQTQSEDKESSSEEESKPVAEKNEIDLATAKIFLQIIVEMGKDKQVSHESEIQTLLSRLERLEKAVYGKEIPASVETDLQKSISQLGQSMLKLQQSLVDHQKQHTEQDKKEAKKEQATTKEKTASTSSKKSADELETFVKDNKKLSLKEENISVLCQVVDEIEKLEQEYKSATDLNEKNKLAKKLKTLTKYAKDNLTVFEQAIDQPEYATHSSKIVDKTQRFDKFLHSQLYSDMNTKLSVKSLEKLLKMIDQVSSLDAMYYGPDEDIPYDIQDQIKALDDQIVVQFKMLQTAMKSDNEKYQKYATKITEAERKYKDHLMELSRQNKQKISITI